MDVIQYNAHSCGSTGKIANGLRNKLNELNISNDCYFQFETKQSLFSVLREKINSFVSHFSGRYGLVAKANTRKFIDFILKHNVKLILFHNIHDHSIDISTLFSFLEKKNIKMIFVMHDCWLFTGYCFNYIDIKCEKWRKECSNCPKRHETSWFFDNSKTIFNIKKKFFINNKLQIIVPSQWMEEQVKESFLSSNEICFIPNPVDLNVFFTKKVTDSKVVLGAAYFWNENKGIEDFNYLAEHLPSEYEIIVLGVRKKQKKLFNKRIKTYPLLDENELANFFRNASVYVNPSKYESFGMTNIESQACGTPVVAYNTSGCIYTVSEETGALVELNDKNSLLDSVIKICEKKVNPETVKQFSSKFSASRVYEFYSKVIIDKLNEK